MELEQLETKLPPFDMFREIGFDTSCWPGKTEEVVFFNAPHGRADTPDMYRMSDVSVAAVKEFVAYWEHQIAIAKEYVANGCNPNTHEWKKP